MKICLLATAWGPTFGGINAFNQDLSIGLAESLANSGQVFCAAIDPTDGDVSDAQRSGVTLIPVRDKPHKEEFDTSWIYEIDEWFKENQIDRPIDWWIGHDIVSGRAALQARKIAGGSTALIHHMSYASYQAYKGDDSSRADAQHRQQRDLFQQTAELFAVGPLLCQSLHDLSGRSPTQLVPGFPKVPARTSSDNRLSAITFGRMERASDRIKQGRLAVAAFGEALRRADMLPGKPKALNGPRLMVIGVDPTAHDEASEIRKLADKHADRAVNLLVLPFDETRASLLQRLSEANLALMLSWHEGFGLTGWEAIAAEVPLIVSTQSGVHQLIDETLRGAGLGCIRPIDVRGWRGSKHDRNFTQKDLDSVAKEIILVASNIPYHRENARTLKKLLSGALGCTWEHTANQLLSALPRPTANIVRGPDYLAPELADAPRIGPFTAAPPDNPIPECCELTIGTTQGSSPTSFDLLPEIRFGREEFEVDDLTVSCGIRQAALRVTLKECQIAAGPRLGDDPSEEPDIAAKGNNTWEIRGPQERGLLARRALGAKPLCRVLAEPNASPEVIVEVSCRARNITYGLVSNDSQTFSITQARILEAFLNKCISNNRGVVTLSRATLRAKNHEVDQ